MSTANPSATQDIVVTNSASLRKILRDHVGINASVRPNGEIAGYIDEVVSAASGRPVFAVITDDRQNAETITAIKAASPSAHVLGLSPQLSAAEIGVAAHAFIAKIAPDNPSEGRAEAESVVDAPEAVSADAPGSSASSISGHASGANLGEADDKDSPSREPMMLTLIRAISPKVITKTFRRGTDGKIIKESAAEMTEGAAGRIDEVFDIRGFADWWTRSELNEGVLCGVSTHECDLAHVITKDSLKGRAKRTDDNGVPFIARSRDYFSYPIGRGLFPVDCDEKKSIDEFREKLMVIAPALYHNAPSAFRHSASAYIFDTIAGKYAIEEGGIRAFFDVADAHNIGEAGKRLFKWAVVKGFGEARITTNGSIRITSPIDPAIYQPERFVFTAKADCRDGLEAHRISPEVFNSDRQPIALDEAIPHLTSGDEADYEAEVARLRAECAAEAAVVRDAWLSKRADDDADHEKVEPQQRKAWVKKRREFHARALDGRDLYASFIITLDDGKNVTVREMLANPSLYDGRLCADPIEPDYDGGRAVGRIKTNGKPTISSFARGGDDGERFWFLHNCEEKDWSRFVSGFAKGNAAQLSSGETVAEDTGNQDRSPEDVAPEVDAASESIIAEMVRRHRLAFEATHRDASVEETEADAVDFEEMARHAAVDRVLDADFKLFVEHERNSRAVTVGDVVASPSDFTGKRVRDPIGVASKFVGRLSLVRGTPRITMFDKSEPFYLIEKPAEGGDRPWSKKKDDGPVITHKTIADIVLQRHGDDIRYVVAMKAWFIWSGSRWLRDAGNHVFELCHGVACEQVPNVEGYDVVCKLESTSFANSVEELLRKKGSIQASATAFDSDKWLLGVPSGVVDLRTGELRQGRRDDMISMATLVDPGVDADCPLWRKFINDATGGDAELDRFLSQWFGYSLTGDVSEQAFVFFHGDGGNGKGVVAKAVQNILGDYAGTADMRTFVAAKGDRASNDLADLRGKRLVIASETALGNDWDEARVKNVTGDDSITARKLYQDNITFDPTFKIAILGNHFPNIRGIGHAMRRRMNVVGFNRRPQKPDSKLSEKLKVEYPAILAWMIKGCLDWQANELLRAQSMIKATEDYFSNQDVFGQWLEDHCNVARDNDDIRDTFANLYRSWSEYAKERGHNNMTGRAFTNTLIERGFQKIKFGGARGYAGVRAVGELATGKRWVREHMSDGSAEVIRPSSFDNGGRRDA